MQKDILNWHQRQEMVKDNTRNAKLMYKGIGCIEDKKQAIKLFQMAKKNRIDKSDKYLSKQETTKLKRNNKNLTLSEKN